RGVFVLMPQPAPRPPAALRRQAGAYGDVLERAVSAVAIQPVLAPVGDEEIVEAVVVVVGDGSALAPSALNEAGPARDVLERPVVPVAEQVVGGFLSFGKAVERTPVDQEHVGAAVVV